eukprot:TRINITY_DN77699_c0_g1_i1.p1 TRINITY_DN77699_c0_g1~~TRINITY_DN77699_c0_g1_i1.p1  ORF type:complete len:378 (-),score=60.41 TRINITY_DN77699_c0_g1_i1:103-1236(-)
MAANGLLCLVWDQSDSVSLRREPPSFIRDFPAGFECDLKLRLPKVKQATPQLSIPLFLCRHVMTLNGSSQCGAPAVAHCHSTALVKSNLQKAMRRGLVDTAVASASYLLAHEPTELMRRLPNVLVEDVGVFADLGKLTWLMMAVQSGYKLRVTDAQFVLAVVAAAASHPMQTECPVASEDEMEAAVSRFASAACDSSGLVACGDDLLAHCLTMRACYGGMGGDLKMLLGLAARESTWRSHVVGACMSSSCSACHGPAWGQALPLQHQLGAAVDFHCSDIVTRLMAYLRSRGGPVPSEEDVKSAMWTYRSSVNVRGVKATSERPVWWDSEVESQLSHFSRIIWTTRSEPRSKGDPERASKRQKTAAPARQLSILRFAA